MSSAILHRPSDLFVGHRAVHHPRGRTGAHGSADRAVPVDRSSIADDQRRLSGSGCGDARRERDPGDGAAAQRRRGISVHVLDQPLERHRGDQRHVRARNRHRRGAHGRPVQIAQRRAAAAGGSAPSGHSRPQSQHRLPDDHRHHLEERQDVEHRAGQLRGDARGRRASPRRRRRRRRLVLIAVCDARLARPGQAGQLPALPRRRSGGGAGAEHSSQRRIDRRAADRRRKRDQRHDPDAEPLHRSGAVRVGHPARESRRLDDPPR